LEALEAGKPIFAPEVMIKNSKGQDVPIRGRTFPFGDGEQFKGVVQVISDISEILSLRRQIDERRPTDFITKCPRLLEVLGSVQEWAESDVPVLILGETGTGKEILARSMHKRSHRKDGPFVMINCGALPDDLLESELFGHVAGAYTDAKKARKGRLRMAEGGTLFLDEIGDMSSRMQIKLLRVLQEKTYEPLGSSETQYCDVRFLSATNKDLHQMLERGSFREDLFYRINTMVIHIPPLRERLEDIPLLLSHFMSKYNLSTGKKIHSIHEKALEALTNFLWPGNVRQLEHAIEHAFVLCKGDEMMPHHLPKEIFQNSSVALKVPASESSLSINRGLTEREIILGCLRKCRWNKVMTSQELGISRSTLWRKMKAYHIPVSSPVK
jgi:transcriptional regulator with PAS, ATPase and Fis domain